MPANITDYRDPTKAKGHYVAVSPEYRKHTSKRRWWNKVPRTQIILTKDGGVMVYYYGDGNTIPWPEVLETADRVIDRSLQEDVLGITVKAGGYLIQRSRDFGQWAGDRNKYSTDLITLVQAMVDRGIATASSSIRLGNTAANEGELIGTISMILRRGASPRQITLYHGTDNYRLSLIMQHGLKPLAFDDRVWNHSSEAKKRPEHRDAAVYLTAAKPQAEYYAKKAVNIDRKRFGPTKRRELRLKVDQAQQTIQRLTMHLERFDRMTPEHIAAEDEHSQRYDRRGMTIEMQRRMYPGWIEEAKQTVAQAQSMLNANFYDKLEPVILQVTLTSREFAKLMADDDYLARHPEAQPTDWRESLSHFGQVAYTGTIPMDRIKVIAQGKDAKQISR